ncbi:hypothetical protein E0F15_04580 [Frankia sp. B2]|uniref:hypothetical protein n=1 Tax=Frankia TaxID=1854 RepID=UPI0004612F7A|nr:MULTISPECIES: hypothetical protein [Frankia]KDA42381.1 hypothetical protein BMG523Draft_02772 [Frankia sp. BMG5.23]ORT54150.1 hypothetical protein KBI5_05235 [Frankia sp. KB5]ORT96923.1 hypothetical protein UK99_07485 [Frankia casuarinae]TFE33714.1 hypothetical protein E0F15_04580 [Frankia sp. B2]
MDANTGRQDSVLGPPGSAALRLITEGLGAALGRLEAAGVVLACDAGDLPTTAVQQAALEERTEAVTAELRRLHGEARRMLARQRRTPAASLSRRAFLIWPGFLPSSQATTRFTAS